MKYRKFSNFNNQHYISKNSQLASSTPTSDISINSLDEIPLPDEIEIESDLEIDTNIQPQYLGETLDTSKTSTKENRFLTFFQNIALDDIILIVLLILFIQEGIFDELLIGLILFLLLQ